MHVLVTGGTGFLGRYIVEQLLARGETVRTYSRHANRELELLGVEVVQGDIRDAARVAAACDGVDCVIHTAAIAGVGMRRNEYIAINLHGTQNVIQGCQKHWLKRLVYTSSPSITFAGFDQAGVDEAVAPNPQWLRRTRAYYSESKMWAESAVLEANGIADLRTCALRPHLIWGPRDNHLIPRLIRRAQRGSLCRVGEGTNLVDTTYVENAAEAHLRAADVLAAPGSPAAGKAYFLSQGAPVNCWDWINEILALADLPPVKHSISRAGAWVLGSTLEAVYRLFHMAAEPPMTRFLAAQLASSHWFDISAACRDLSYQPRITTSEGMLRLGEWLRGPDGPAWNVQRA